METLCRLYLELANVVPPDCLSSREITLRTGIRTIRSLAYNPPRSATADQIAKLCDDLVGEK